MGGRPPDVTDFEILKVIESADDPVLFTSEVANELPIKRQGTLQRLNEFADRDLVHKKQQGNCIVWWLSDSGIEFLKEK